MSGSPPICRTATVFAFSGDRAPAFATGIFTSLRDTQNGRGVGPAILDCLLFLGHAGISLDAGAAIWSFNPDTAGMATWHAMNVLRRGEALRGTVSDDTHVFASARNRGLGILSYDVTLPDRDSVTLRVRLTWSGRRATIHTGSRTATAIAIPISTAPLWPLHLGGICDASQLIEQLSGH